MRVRIARSATEMDELRPTWEALYASTEGATIFQSFAWNRLAAAHFTDREQPYVVLAESDSGVALVPAARGRDRLTLLGDELFDYRDALTAGDSSALRVAWAELARLRLPLHITALRGEQVRARWAALSPSAFVKAPAVRRADIDAQSFAQAHPGIGRYVRRLHREGAELRRYDGTATALIASIYRQKSEQPAIDGQENLFRDPARVAFMEAACALDPAACEIFSLEAGSRLVAALITFRDHETRRFYTIVFEQSWARFSPGTALCFETSRLSLEEGLDCDYMTGEQPHKVRFTTSSTPLYRLNAPAALLARAAGLEVAA